LEDQIESLKGNIDHIQESIDSEENLDAMDLAGLVQGLTELDSRYLIEKLYNMTVNQSYLAAQKEVAVKEMEAKLNELKQQKSTQQQLSEHLLNEGATNDSIAVLSDSSANSSRSNSPTETCNGNAESVNLTIAHKVRNHTALPKELLYPIISTATNQDWLAVTELPSTTVAEEERTDSNMIPSPLAGGIMFPVHQVHSTANRPDQLKPSTVAMHKVYDRQESTSPRLTRRTINLAQGNLLGKPGSILALT
jgi:hypothetical protein